MSDNSEQPGQTGGPYRPSDWYVNPTVEPARPAQRRGPGGLVVLALAGGLALGLAGGAVSGALVARNTAAVPTAVTVAAPAAAPTAIVVAAAPTAVASAAATATPAASPTVVAAATVSPRGQQVAAVAASGVVSDVYNRVGPAVVSIGSRGQGRGGIGSGVIIDPQGFVVTNNHVVEGSTSLSVILADGTSLSGRIVGTAPGNDLALIKIEPPAGGLATAKLGDSDAVLAGEVAIAIGSPSGLEQTVTAGIVSSTGRTFGGGAGGTRPLRGLIQTDAAINPGNSGGPLLNSIGEVIGINTLKAPDTQGIGFAVPVNTVKRLLPQLRTGGKISTPYLGISGRPVNAQVAQTLNLTVNEGVLIASVVEGGPAATAGIVGGTGQGEGAGRGGDVITAIDGQPVRRVEDIGAILDSKKVGDTVEVAIARGGERKTLKVVLAEWPTS